MKGGNLPYLPDKKRLPYPPKEKVVRVPYITYYFYLLIKKVFILSGFLRGYVSKHKTLLLGVNCLQLQKCLTLFWID